MHADAAGWRRSEWIRAIAVATVVACLPAAAPQASPPVVETEALTPDEQRGKFRLPPGFEIQLVAAEPLIQKPMNMAFDARGRLWVTHSIEYPWAVPADKKPRDGLTILEDFDADGKARKATRFADELNIPIGVLPLPTGPDAETAAIVWSIPNIWKLTDTDNDGKADRREVLYGPFDFADTHGNQNSFRLGADGWVYANHGFRNRSRVKLRGEGEVVLELDSGNGYRFRPDGSAIEHVTWGQVNPFGMCFDALGNRFNADCHSKPLNLLLRGGRYLSVFAPPNRDYNDGLGLAPETTGDDHGSTGIAAVAVVDTDRMPADYQGSVFVGNVVNNLVHRDRIEWRGSSPWVQKPEEFLACDDLWFRPGDMHIGADGALYIADFYNCIIGHYEVDLKHPRRDRERGRIWRVVWKGAAGGAPVEAAPMPDLTALADDALVARLADPNETVRRLALEQVVERGRRDPAIVALVRRPDPSEHRRARSLHALALLGKLDDATISTALADDSREVRVHLVKALDALPGWDAARAELVRARLADADPFVRRAAAEALGAHPATASIPALLQGAKEAAADDKQLIHALRIALRDQVRAASPEELASLTVPADDVPRLLEVATTVPGPAVAWWAFALARDSHAPTDLLRNTCAGVARHCQGEQLDEAVRLARSSSGDELAAQAGTFQTLLDAVVRSGRRLQADDELGRWGRSLVQAVLVDPPAEPPADHVVVAALHAAEKLREPAAQAGTLRTLRDRSRRANVRETAAITALALDRAAGLAAVAALVGDAAEPADARQVAARLLGGAEEPAAREALAAAIAVAAAGQQREFAMALASRKEGAEALLTLVGAGKASPLLLQDRQIVQRVRQSGMADADPRIQALTSGLPAADDRIRDMIGRVAGRYGTKPGSPQVGAELFAKNCAACHRYAGTGGLVGPQLDGVGQRGPERLLEDILDPNRNIDEAFRTTTVTTADGRVVSGLKLREEGAEVVFADSAGKEVRVAKGDIEETTVARLSPMPANIGDQVGEANLPDLLAFLLRHGQPSGASVGPAP